VLAKQGLIIFSLCYAFVLMKPNVKAKIMFMRETNKLNLGSVMWSSSLMILIPLMLIIILIVRPITKRHYEPKWITKWYKKTGSKLFY